jgi:drug/metabolite transporter (DMT)-like permease
VITAKAKDYIPLLTFSFWTFSLAALLSFPFTVDSNVIEIFTYDWIFWLNFLLVTFGSMVFATTVYFYGTVILGSERASAFIFTVPLSALIFSMIFLREPLEISTVLGGILAMAAVYMINRTKRILPPT